MPRSNTRGHVVLAVVSTLSFAGCVREFDEAPSNLSLYAGYERMAAAYENEMVDTRGLTQTSPESEPPVSPEVVAAISSQLADGYHRDIERCVEMEMERLENRWLGGQLAIELHIAPDGRVHRTHVRDGVLREHRAPDGSALVSTAREANEFDECLASTAETWQFSPPPRRSLVHGYTVAVGEAW